jgi:hypothetical protein
MAKVKLIGPPVKTKKVRFQGPPIPGYGFPELGYQAGPGGKQVPYGQSPRYANPGRWTADQEKWQNQHVGWKAKVRYRARQAGMA